MSRIPFGVERLDNIVGGGAPPGSVVLLVGEGGAGAREFLYTSAAMNGLARADPDLFEIYYGAAVPPGTAPEVHYLSFTTGEEYIEREMANTVADEVVEAALPKMTVRDFSPQYFGLSPVPRSWYAGETQAITDLGESERGDGALSALGDYLTEHASGNLVLIDSVTDLVAGVSDEMQWSDVAMLMKGLEKAANRWGGANPAPRQPRDAHRNRTRQPAGRRLGDVRVRVGVRRLEARPNDVRQGVPGRPLPARGGEHRPVRDRDRRGRLRHQRRSEDPVNGDENRLAYLSVPGPN